MLNTKYFTLVVWKTIIPINRSILMHNLYTCDAVFTTVERELGYHTSRKNTEQNV